MSSQMAESEAKKDVYEKTKVVEVEGLEPTNSEEGSFTDCCRCRLATLPFVGKAGLEPTTFCVSGRCSNQLSYFPKTRLFSRTIEAITFLNGISKNIVKQGGLEPPTSSSSQPRRSVRLSYCLCARYATEAFHNDSVPQTRLKQSFNLKTKPQIN